MSVLQGLKVMVSRVVKVRDVDSITACYCRLIAMLGYMIGVHNC